MPDPVLLVEPDEQNRALHRLALQHAGFRVVEARTGEEAIWMACREVPRVVVMACHTPGVSGLRATEVLKEEPGLRDVPVVLLGSAAGEEEARSAHAAGCDVYVPRPHGPLVVLPEVRRLAGEAPRRLTARGAAAAPRRGQTAPMP